LHFVLVNVSGLDDFGYSGEGGYDSWRGVDSTVIYIRNKARWDLLGEVNVLIHEWLHGVEGRTSGRARPGLHSSGNAVDLAVPWLGGEERLREVYKGYFNGTLTLNGQAGVHPGWWPSLGYR
jgi:hypothetical protein